MGLQKSKHIKRTREHHAEKQKKSDDSERAADLNLNGLSVVDGWQKYRRGNPTPPFPRQHLRGIDPSLYSWTDYNSWTAYVRRNWFEE